MKKRDLSDDEKELWKEFSKSTNPLPNQDQKTQETKPEKKKRINPVNLKDKEIMYITNIIRKFIRINNDI